MFSKVLSIFNSINSSLQFTLEVPETSEPINFLDLSIYINDQSIRHTWYSKNSHSEITLKPDSYLPKHVKANFVVNSVRQVAEKCPNIALGKLDRRLYKNGFKNVNFEKILKGKNKNKPNKCDDPVFLQTIFINDRFTKNVNKIIGHYNFPVKVISKPNKKLSQCFIAKKRTKHVNCKICDHLPDKYRCDDRYVVYKLTCNICKKSYIGETSRPFHLRLDEHKRSITNSDNKSALADHARIDHCDEPMTFDHFQFDLIAKFRNPVETRIGEARLINFHRPELNRRHEMAQW